MDVPKASIIIPAYNYGHYVAETVESAVAQSYPNVEVIVVDDGSTDDTDEVCKRFGDRIRYHHKENAGLSAARNTGIKLATGEFLVFLDADDVLHPKMVETCMKEFESGENELAVVACRRMLIDENGARMEQSSNLKQVDGDVTMRDLLLKNRITVAGALVRAAVFDVCGGFDEMLTSSEDRDMWIRIASSFQLKTIPNELVDYRVHSGSMSRNADRMNANMTTVLTKARATGVNVSAGFLFWSSVFSFKDYQVAWMMNAQGQSVRAMGFLLRSLFRYPYFMDHVSLGNPLLFRLRALRLFIVSLFTGGGR